MQWAETYSKYKNSQINFAIQGEKENSSRGKKKKPENKASD